MLRRWEYKTSNNIWVAYSERDQAEINAAHLNRQKCVEVCEKTTTVHLDEMKQKKNGGKGQAVRSVEDESPHLTFLWQHDFPNKWVNFKDDEQIYLNQAFGKSQMKIILLSDNISQFTVNFETLRVYKKCQRGKFKRGKKSARLRCAFYSGGKFYVWRERSYNGVFNCYPPAVVLAIEDAYKRRKSNVNIYYKKYYEINIETNCSVSREQIDVDINSGVLSAICEGFSKSLSKQHDLQQITQSRSKRIKIDVNLQKKIPVDPECVKHANCHIYQEGEIVYDVMLNETNVKRKSNEFLLMQLLEDDTNKEYSVWSRTGKVGCKGQTSLLEFRTDLKKAKKTFEENFYEQTQNNWKNSSNFCKVSGKYDLLKLDRAGVLDRVQPYVSNIDTRLYSLLKMICNKTTMENVINETKYDSTKIPLGSLTEEQISSGYAALNILIGLIKTSGKASQLVEASSDFYTRIPHRFYSKAPPVIQTLEMVRKEIKMLEALSEIRVAMNLLGEQLCRSQHPIDMYYKLLECELKALNSRNAAYKVIEKYLTHSHGPTHAGYKMQLIDVYECYTTSNFKDYGNSKLLWHGSRLMSNFVGILKKGFRLPSREAACFLMFGRGIYFADISSKSANYCDRTPDNCGLLALCEVSMGKVKEEYRSVCYMKPPSGCHSVKGLGRYRPSPGVVEFISGMEIEVGFPERHPDSLNTFSSFRLHYNEYIVYDANQVRLKYLVHVRFLS